MPRTSKLTSKINHIIVQDLTVEIVRKKIKHMHLSVRPPNGHVRVSTPLHVEDDTVRRMVISRLDWIRRQQARIAAQKRQPNYEYLSGEQHIFQGRHYFLEVTYRDAAPGVLLHGERLELSVRPGSDMNTRKRVLTSWYRQQLKESLPALTAKWQAIIGVQASEWRIRQMKSRWGSCNIQKRRIWLNLELAKISTDYLEYIIVHELVHLIERQHNRHFKALINQFMPEWKLRRDKLGKQRVG